MQEEVESDQLNWYGGVSQIHVLSRVRKDSLENLGHRSVLVSVQVPKQCTEVILHSHAKQPRCVPRRSSKPGFRDAFGMENVDAWVVSDSHPVLQDWENKGSIIISDLAKSF